MTKKDYELVVRAFKRARKEANDNGEIIGVGLALAFIIDEMASENPRFDRVKFRKAIND